MPRLITTDYRHLLPTEATKCAHPERAPIFDIWGRMTSECPVCGDSLAVATEAAKAGKAGSKEDSDV